MTYLYLLLSAYGVTFGLQNKLPFLWGKVGILDNLLTCTYCTGFHAGWLVWILWKFDPVAWMVRDSQVNVAFSMMDVILFAFASSVFAYLMDSAIRVMEHHSDPLE